MKMITKLGVVMLAVAALAVAGCKKEKGDADEHKGHEHPAEGQKPKDHPAH